MNDECFTHKGCLQGGLFVFITIGSIIRNNSRQKQLAYYQDKYNNPKQRHYQ